jgi:choline dehydrogenase-like flavoprotein
VYYQTSISTVLYNPLSRGRTHISSADPLAAPLVDPNYWAHPLDVAAHVAGIKLARKMLTTPPLGSFYTGEFEPGLDKQTDESIERWLRANVTSDNHQIGSMAMLPQALGGVVDTELKIYGTKNVRVIGRNLDHGLHSNTTCTERDDRCINHTFSYQCTFSKCSSFRVSEYY